MFPLTRCLHRVPVHSTTAPLARRWMSAVASSTHSSSSTCAHANLGASLSVLKDSGCYDHGGMTAAQAVLPIKSNDNVFIHTGAATPVPLVEAMVDRSDELRNVSTFSLHTEGPARYVEDQYVKSFKHHAFFVGANVRKAVNGGNHFYCPTFLSNIPKLFSSGRVPLDVALVQVSEPDKHGYVSLGVSVDVSATAVTHAKKVIAMVNPNMPRTHGDGNFHISKLNPCCTFVRSDAPIHEITPNPPTEVQNQIGVLVASLIEDGACLQMGIGAIPDAVLNHLHGHKDLGVHTEMFTDGLVDLVHSGVVNNRLKKVTPGKTIVGFVIGSKKTYDFVDDNPQVVFRNIDFVNDPRVIARNDKMTAINSALEIDLTGQVCADSLGSRVYSGVGGQLDFVMGAQFSEGGKPIIALESTTSRGESKIVSMLRPGAGVTTTRAHAHYVVTEYGIAMVDGSSLEESARSLINIAHPDHREQLEREAHDLFKMNLSSLHIKA
eukprot:TRINITY_DN533_c0_g2_i1.p1 TRINITY_DN533_c0_g2~~TRINITY_DN533_c0_g2_i1.p1  ORF type:complete len:504 (+),score=114.19 TRINITY_DN533_c0_g2_i1:36-1514(+)